MVKDIIKPESIKVNNIRVGKEVDKDKVRQPEGDLIRPIGKELRLLSRLRSDCPPTDNTLRCEP